MKEARKNFSWRFADYSCFDMYQLFEPMKKKIFYKNWKKIILLLSATGVVILIIMVLLPNIEKKQKKTSSESISPIENIPDQREDINSQLTLEQLKKGQKLSPAEEKTIIESLASQTNIDKEKSFFDYGWGFGMNPSVREAREDYDQALYLFTDKGKFFVKINPFSDLSRFEHEKESMEAINEAVLDLAPRPFCLGNLPKGGKFLVMNFLESHWEDITTVEAQKLLAQKLAQLHQKKSPNGKFGFHIGKNNQWKDNWATFFQENRWQPLWERFLKKLSPDEELKKWGEIISKKVIPDLLGNLKVEPVLLHGTLEFDNFSINSQTKEPFVFSACSYYGHNEIDLSLLGFYLYPPDAVHEPDFFAEYQKHHSLPPGFEERKDLYRLYHWLYNKTLYYNETTKRFRRELLFKMKKLGQKLKTCSINVEIEKISKTEFMSTKQEGTIENQHWVYLKVRPFNYNSKTIEQIKIEIGSTEDAHNIFEEEAEYTIEAEKMIVKHRQLIIPLLWKSKLIEGKLEKLIRKKDKKLKN